ncbi:MAG: hypothetical protein JWQ08_1103, partial [Deinococcus sp.]|nr:hypothetical protein [Deinococcus sp.]
ALLTLNSVQASTFTPLTLVQQAKKAQVIVRATVGEATTTQTGGVSWINYPLTVTETIAGDVSSLPVQGGKPTLMFLAGLQDVPALNSGQDVFLLLYTGTQDSPLVGFNQGAYPVVGGRVTRWNEAATAAESGTAPPTTAAASATPSTPTSTAATAASRPAAGTVATAPAATDAATAAVGNPVVPSPTPAPAAGTAAGTGTAAIPATASAPAPVGTAAATPAASTTSPSTTPPATAPALPNSAATTTPTATPDPFERDPVKFRDQLRAARNTP